MYDDSLDQISAQAIITPESTRDISRLSLINISWRGY